MGKNLEETIANFLVKYHKEYVLIIDHQGRNYLY